MTDSTLRSNHLLILLDRCFLCSGLVVRPVSFFSTGLFTPNAEEKYLVHFGTRGGILPPIYLGLQPNFA